MAGPCENLAEPLQRPRVYLAGRVTIEHGERLVDEATLPGRQGRLAFFYLAANRHKAVSRDELVEAVWGHEPPPAIDTALSALLSRIRAVLKSTGWSTSEAGIDVRSGAASLKLPVNVWVDLEGAANAIDEAEGALRAGDTVSAWSHSNVVVVIGRRELLPDYESPWIEARRRIHRALLRRGLECLATTSERLGDHVHAVDYTNEVLDLEPFRETSYRTLMRMHASVGNRAEALRVYDRCRTLLRDELGASPSPETQSAFLEILRAEA